MPKKLTPERRQVLKEELMASLEEEVEAYLDWYDNTEGLKFREVEKQVLAIRREMGMRLAETIVAEESAAMETMRQCPVCGGKLRGKGGKEKVVVSLVGEVKVRREYYYCSHCQRGFFPPGPNHGDERGLE